MIYGLGMDLVEIDRIALAQDKRAQFAERVLTPAELVKYQAIEAPRRKAEYLAGRYAAKEAFSKAYGTGIGKEVSFLDITITNDPKTGKPDLQQVIFPGKVHLTITHTKTTAGAVVILEKA